MLIQCLLRPKTDIMHLFTAATTSEAQDPR